MTRAPGRLETHLRDLRREGRKSLVPYLTAGFPDATTTRHLAVAAIDAGADAIEFGIPFSDPVADGPAIQFSSASALEAGMTVAGSLELIADIASDRPGTPIIAMTYMNPLLSIGLETFLERFASSGGSEPAAASGCTICFTSNPADGSPRPDLCEPGTTRVPPFLAEKSSRSHTVFIITGEAMFNISCGMSLCSVWSPSPGQTIRALRLPRTRVSPRKCSRSGRVRGWSMASWNTLSRTGRLLTWRALPRWVDCVPCSASQRMRASRMADTRSPWSTSCSTTKPYNSISAIACSRSVITLICYARLVLVSHEWLQCRGVQWSCHYRCAAAWEGVPSTA